jgi:hypothetical protein
MSQDDRKLSEMTVEELKELLLKIQGDEEPEDDDDVFDGCGCAGVILAICAGIALILWAL